MEQTRSLQSSSTQRSGSAIPSSNIVATNHPTRPQSTTTERSDYGQNFNPYKKSIESSTLNQPNQNSQGSTKQYQQNSMERQHPHRAGKIRLDKQFQVHLQVSALSDDDTSSSSSDDSTPNQNQRKASTYWSRSGSSKSRTSQSTKENKSNQMDNRKSSRFLDMDDDEDDHELLGCVPFAKVSRKK